MLWQRAPEQKKVNLRITGEAVVSGFQQITGGELTIGKNLSFQYTGSVCHVFSKDAKQNPEL